MSLLSISLQKCCAARNFLTKGLLSSLKVSFNNYIQGVHKVRVHFKKFITLFLCTIKIICKKDLKEVNRYFVMFC